MKWTPDLIIKLILAIGVILNMVFSFVNKQTSIREAKRLEKSIDSTDRIASDNFAEILKALEK